MVWTIIFHKTNSLLYQGKFSVLFVMARLNLPMFFIQIHVVKPIKTHVFEMLVYKVFVLSVTHNTAFFSFALLNLIWIFDSFICRSKWIYRISFVRRT